MKKRVLALLLTMSLAGSSLLPVSAMETGEGSFDDTPGQEQEIGEEGKEPAETAVETEKKTEGDAPGLGNDENTLPQGGNESQGEEEQGDDPETETPGAPAEEDENEGQGGQGIIEDDQKTPGNTDGALQGEESSEPDFEWTVSREQIRILNGEKAYFYVSFITETDDENQIQAESSDESAVTVEAVPGEDVSPELAGEAPENAVWYEVAAVNTGEYAVIVTFRGEEKQIAVYVESPALLKQNGMEQIQTADNAEMDTASPQAETAAEAGWSEDGLYYTNEDGSLCKGIAEIEGVLYYFDESTGKLCKEAKWIDKEDRRYFCSGEGILYRDQFIKFGDTYYYMGADGSVQTGFVTASDGNSYYADTETGVIRKASWIEAGGERYFADASGKLYQNQLIKFGDTYYYMGSDGSVQKGFISASGGSRYYADPETGEIWKSTWIEDGEDRYFADESGKLYQNQFIKFGNTYYYMGADGSVQTGFVTASDGNSYYADTETGVIQKSTWIKDGEDRYFADESGKLYQNQFIKFGDTYYYMGNDGSVQKGVVKAADGCYYNLDENTGILQKKADWVYADDKEYFADANGKLYQNQFIKFGDTYYYMGSDASVQKGIVKAADGCYYNLDKETGILIKAAGWLYEGEKDYFADANGKLYQNQFIKFGDTYYYMGSDASVQKGIVKAADGCYYNLDKETGILIKAAGWLEEGEKDYFADANGKLYQNQFIKFGDTYYYMGADASVQKGVVKASDGHYYHLDESTGILQKKAGWVYANNKQYYSDANGKLYQSQFIKFGDIYYYCGSDAAIVKSQTVPVNGVLYKFDADGIMVKEGGWGTYNGNRYYKNPATGFPYTGWVTFGNTWYYANSNGFMVKGWQTIGGYRYYFYPSTYIMARNDTIDGIYIRSDGKADTMYTYAANVLNRVGWNLRAAYNWSAGLPYTRMNSSPSQGSAWFARYGFENHTGNCYVMAATFYYMAKVLGYDAHQVAGYVPKIGGGVTPHSWVEIVMNGTVYVFDPNFTNETGGNGYQIRYGTSGTWMYSSYYRMN